MDTGLHPLDVKFRDPQIDYLGPYLIVFLIVLPHFARHTITLTFNYCS